MIYLELRTCLSDKSEYQAGYCSGKSLNLCPGGGGISSKMTLTLVNFLRSKINVQTDF
jgi:hypothetical protein